MMRLAFVAVAIGAVCAEIVNLNENNFKELVESDTSDSIWLLDFYAPWCGHCKRLNPVLDELELVLPANVKIGKIDASYEKKLAGLHHVTGFPTLKYRKGGKYFDYDGARDLESFKELFARLQAPAVAHVSSSEELKDLLDEQSPLFLLFNPKSDKKIASAFGSVATDLQAKGTFVATSSIGTVEGIKVPGTKLSEGFVARLEKDRRPLVFADDSLTDAAAMLAFVEKHNHNFINHLTQFNYRSLSSKGKTMSVLLIDYDHPLHKHTINLYQDAAEALGEEGMNHFVFGHIDGVRWAKYFNRFEVTEPFPKLLFTQPDVEQFFHDASVDLTNAQSVQRAMRSVMSGESQLHKITWATTFKVLQGRVLEGGQLTWMVVFSILAICATIWFAYPREQTGASADAITEQGEDQPTEESKQKSAKKSKNQTGDNKPKED